MQSRVPEYLISNGASKDVHSPMFCSRARLNKLITIAEQKGSKIIILTDPQGQSVVLYELIDDEWRQVGFEEIIMLVMETLKKKN